MNTAKSSHCELCEKPIDEKIFFNSILFSESSDYQNGCEPGETLHKKADNMMRKEWNLKSDFKVVVSGCKNGEASTKSRGFGQVHDTKIQQKLDSNLEKQGRTRFPNIGTNPQPKCTFPGSSELEPEARNRMQLALNELGLTLVDTLDSE